MAATRLLIATSDRDLLVSLLIFLREEEDMRIVGTASDCESALALARSAQPDVMLVDETLLVKVAESLHRVKPRPYLIVLTTQGTEATTLAGADAVALKYVSPESLLNSVRRAVE